MKIIDVVQGTDEWKSARAGKITASRVSDMLAKGKGSAESASRRNLKAQLVAETLTGSPQEFGYTNDAMRWGTEQEPYARAAYEVAKHVMVDQVGMVIHPTIDRAAASPDGMIDLQGLVEIKCPNTATHLDYLLAGTVPTDYQPQMLWQMACTGAIWCDFVSYDPRLPDHLQLFVKRFHRDDERIAAMEAEALALLADVDAIIDRLPKVSDQSNG